MDKVSVIFVPCTNFESFYVKDKSKVVFMGEFRKIEVTAEALKYDCDKLSKLDGEKVCLRTTGNKMAIAKEGQKYVLFYGGIAKYIPTDEFKALIKGLESLL